MLAQQRQLRHSRARGQRALGSKVRVPDIVDPAQEIAAGDVLPEPRPVFVGADRVVFYVDGDVADLRTHLADLGARSPVPQGVGAQTQGP